MNTAVIERLEFAPPPQGGFGRAFGLALAAHLLLILALTWGLRWKNEPHDLAVQAEHGYGHTASMYSKNLDALHRMARVANVSIFVKNASNYAGLGFGGEGYTSFTIASPTGEGLTNATHFTRERRCTLVDSFRIV